jgi:hypothetical protein
MKVVLLVLAILDLQSLLELDPYWWSYVVVKFGGGFYMGGCGVIVEPR